MKILFISNIVTGRLGNFSIPSIIAAQKLGYEFHFAANWSKVDKSIIQEEEKKYGIKIHHIDFERSPFDKKNYRAYKQLRELMNKYRFDAIHCNTPIGSILGRLCAKQSGISKVIYTAHGFHFYKGAPKINNIIYKNVEKYLAKLTDCIITITKEDYNSALEFKKINKKLDVYYIPGVGVNIDEIIKTLVDREAVRKELGIPNDSILIISAGELNKNKNQKIIIDAISKIEDNENIHYIVCGQGHLEEVLKKMVIEKQLSRNIHFLGYRNDIVKLMKASDIFVLPSYREGLSRSIMEAMASGMPVIASKIRGNVDLIKDNEGGFLCYCNDTEAFSMAIEKLINKEARRKMGDFNLEYSQKFDVTNIKKEMLSIYSKQMNIKKDRTGVLYDR